MGSVTKALTRLASGVRSTNWEDWRNRSPKSLNDMSGVIFPRVGSTSNLIQDFDYETMEKILYCNDMAWTCIELVSSTAALGKLKVRIRKGKEITYVPDHPLQHVLDFPNGSMTQYDLIQSYVYHQKLYGTVGMILMRQSMAKDCSICLQAAKDECLHKLWNIDGPITGIMTVHPTTLTQDWVELDGQRRMIFFYTPSPGRKFPIHPNNILTDPYYNPVTGFYGISPTFLLQRWLSLDASMTGQIKQLFDNGSIPSMIVSLKPGQNYTHDTEPETLMNVMKEKWMSNFSANGKTQKAPAFVYGDISVETLEEKIEEKVAKGLYYEIQGHVCATYGVPPTLYEMGMKFGSQRASAEQAEKDFYNRTIQKILTRIELKINQLIVPSYKTEGLEVVWDLTNMGIASFIIEGQKTAIKKDWELGLITRDETRLSLGYDALGGEFGDDLYRLSVMSDGSNGQQAAGMDNRLKLDKTSTTTTD